MVGVADSPKAAPAAGNARGMITALLILAGAALPLGTSPDGVPPLVLTGGFRARSLFAISDVGGRAGLATRGGRFELGTEAGLVVSMGDVPPFPIAGLYAHVAPLRSRDWYLTVNATPRLGELACAGCDPWAIRGAGVGWRGLDEGDPGFHWGSGTHVELTLERLQGPGRDAWFPLVTVGFQFRVPASRGWLRRGAILER